jgi:hypothetical protein
MRGKDGTTATGKKLHTALELLQGSFDPIMDGTNSVDLLPLIVQARVRMACVFFCAFVVCIYACMSVGLCRAKRVDGHDYATHSTTTKKN